MPTGRYFDGTSSRPRVVEARAEADDLRLEGDGFERSIGREQLHFAPATGGGPSRVTFADGGQCEFDDRASADALFAALGFAASPVDRLVSRTRYAVAALVGFAVVMGGLYVWVVPWAADALVAQAPRAWDRRLGDEVLDALDERKLFRPTRLPEARRDHLVQRFDALRLPLDRAGFFRANLRIEFRRFGAPNALALPGDIIVVTDEMVELAGDDDEALLTVFAHEAGHVDHRDALRGIVRGTLLSAIATWYLGDVSNLAAVVAGGIGSLKYSREAERAADRYAIDAMHANGLSTKPAAALFRRLEAWTPAPRGKAAAGGRDATPGAASKDDGGDDRHRFDVPEYLSTHPATEDRVRLFEADATTPSTSR